MKTKHLVMIGSGALLVGILTGVLISVNSGKNAALQKVQTEQAMPAIKNDLVPLQPDPEPTIRYFPDDSASIEMLNAALDLLKKRCVHVKNYTDGDVDVALHLYRDNYDYRQQKYGWSDEILIEITIPNNSDNPAEMAGQTLHYYIGKGRRPGITMNKWQEKSLCNAEDDGSGDDVFLPLEDVLFL